MPLPLSRRMGFIAPFHVMVLLAPAQALEAAGRAIIHIVLEGGAAFGMTYWPVG